MGIAPPKKLPTNTNLKPNHNQPLILTGAGGGWRGGGQFS